MGRNQVFLEVPLDDYVQECIHEKNHILVLGCSKGRVGGLHYLELSRWKMLRREPFFFLLFSVASAVGSLALRGWEVGACVGAEEGLEPIGADPIGVVLGWLVEGDTGSACRLSCSINGVRRKDSERGSYSSVSSS